MQTDYMARNMTDVCPPFYDTSEMFFCAIFTGELFVRLCKQRMAFFCMQGCAWNWYDVFLVLLQWTEVFVILVTAGGSQPAPMANFSFMRLLKILRLFRVLRIVRLLQFFGELNVVAAALVHSMQSLLGTIVLLLLLTYTFGILFTQVVFSYRLGSAEEITVAEGEVIAKWWGNLPRAGLSLFKSIMAGTNWENPLDPLFKIHITLAMLFLAYVTFSLLAMMNVITGIFVQSALKYAEQMKEKSFVIRFGEFFHCMDPDSDGIITREEYLQQIQDPDLQGFMFDMGIDPGEARILFDFIDSDGSDTLDAEELVGGLVRLKQGAKFIDNITVLHEIHTLAERWEEWSKDMTTQVGSIDIRMKAVTKTQKALEKITSQYRKSLMPPEPSRMVPRRVNSMNSY